MGASGESIGLDGANKAGPRVHVSSSGCWAMYSPDSDKCVASQPSSHTFCLGWGGGVYSHPKSRIPGSR